MTLSPRQLALLALVTLSWGLNWPVMKLGVTGFPPLTFRALSVLLAIPVLALTLLALRVPFRVGRPYWRELAWLTVLNMIVWQVLVILALPMLSSGRAAILGYTMPVFSALWGAVLFGQRLGLRQRCGVLAAGTGVALLLWHELDRLSGAPLGVALMIGAAATWALGTQRMRATTIPAPTLAITFWITLLTGVVVGLLAVLFEAARWHRPSAPVAGALLYNAVLIFGLVQAAWFALARGLPPVASTLSVMLIPVLGTVAGALWLGEALHWQDGAALALMAVAIATVLWPARR